jgi:hypothetical protein
LINVRLTGRDKGHGINSSTTFCVPNDTFLEAHLRLGAADFPNDPHCPAENSVRVFTLTQAAAE